VARIVALALACFFALACTPIRDRRAPLAQEQIATEESARPEGMPEGVTPEERAAVLRKAITWVIDDARGATAGAAKRLGFVVVAKDDLRADPPEVTGLGLEVTFLPLRLVEELARQKRHAFVYLIVSEVYRKRDLFQVAFALRQVWVGEDGEVMHAAFGKDVLQEYVPTPNGLELRIPPEPPPPSPAPSSTLKPPPATL